MGRNWKHRRDDGGSMLATIIVIVGGAGLCCFLAMAADSSMLLQAGVAIGSLLAIVQIIRYRYGRDSTGKLSIWHIITRRPNDDNIAAHYHPERVIDKHSEARVGTNKPISAEEAHQIQITSSNTWVPSKATAERKDSA